MLYIAIAYYLLAINPGDNFMQEKQRDKTAITNVAEKELDLLSRHIDILKTVRDHGPIGIIRLSQVTGQPQHVIRYSLRTLEHDGIIKPSSQGAIITDKVHDTLGTLESTLDEMITTMTDLKKKLK
jgi:predicted transcriptional regulator